MCYATAFPTMLESKKMDGRYEEFKMVMITIIAVIATFFVSLRVNMLILVKTNPMASDDITITILMASTNSGVMENAPPAPKLLKNNKLEPNYQ